MEIFGYILLGSAGIILGFISDGAAEVVFSIIAAVLIMIGSVMLILSPDDNV